MKTILHFLREMSAALFGVLVAGKGERMLRDMEEKSP